MKRAIILLLVVTLFGVSFMNCSGPDSNAEEEVAKIPVEISNVTKGTVQKELRYTGDVKAEQEVKVFSKIPDRIVRFEKDEGDYVKKGDVIALIEATKIKQAVVQAEAALVSAKAQLANLESEYQRAQRLRKEDVMSQQQYETIETQYEATQAVVEQSQAALLQAKSQLDDATITAPISGVIGIRNYEQGDMASGPLPLVTIVQMKQVKVEINAPEQDLGQIKKDQCANIKVTSYPDETFVGTISKIRPVLDPITRMGKIEIMVDNEDGRLKPGMFAEVTICINTLEDVIVIPKHAIMENTALKRIDGQDVAVIKSHVFVVNDDTAYLREIDVSYTNATVSVVSGGLDLDEKIVVIGQQSLKDSAAVKIIESQN
ncbi:efflux RND transporter periplasmic adaptor subunit [candidate division KSB1 bacterium]|nr:efflux RND transporter periplasmic adaptor subunit [candidate division KSB1 bacterium]